MQETNSETVGFRLSPQQDRLLGVDDDRSLVQVAAGLARPVHEGDLRASLEQVVARHEILRTTFPKSVGMRGRTQVIHDSLAPEFTSRAGEPASPAALMAREAERPFDLDRGPLVRALLMSAEQQQGVLILTAHAACADARSLLLVLEELAQSYGRHGEPGEAVQYADYAEWRHELITGEDQPAADGRTFWLSQQEDRPGAPRLLFVCSDTASADRVEVPVPLRNDELIKLRAAAQAAGVAPAVFLEACWHSLIARLTGASELVLAGWCDGRAQPDLELAVGPYAQPVPVRSRIQAETSFAEVLDQVRRGRTDASRWQDFASAGDLEALSAEPAAGFIHHDVEALADPVLEVAALNPSAGIRLLLASRAVGEDLSAQLWHDPAVHDPQDVVELVARLRTLIAGAAADLACPVMRLAITDEAERQALLDATAGPEPADQARTQVHRLFEGWARLTPDAPAVAEGEVEISYGRLNLAANRLARLLCDRGVQPGQAVGLCMERTPALLEALLGILKAGGAYVPLNYEHPPARLAHQLEEAGAKVLVSEAHLLEHVGQFAGEVVCIDRDRELMETFSGQDPEPAGGPEDLAYVMYTSGSTGLPKGVAVTHRNLANYSTYIAGRLATGVPGPGNGSASTTAGLRFGVVSAISTDLGNTCIFPPLISGGCVQLVSPGASMNGEAMAAELGGTPLDVLKITPSHLRAVLAGDRAAEALPRKWLILGGEALSWEFVARIRELAPACRIINHYGPTETTVGCCAYDVGEPRADAATVPIGWALAGERAYVLDSGLELLPAGIPGELWIAGEGVAAGYVGADRDGNGAFRADPFSAGGAVRMYRTGDRARYLRDGAIEFLGRVDEQVKIRGFRIEPGEIESSLLRHPAIRQAAVIPEQDERGEIRLVGYVATSAAPSVEELQEFLADSLPQYMVPSAFAMLQSLPFTASGKVDRQALRDLATAQTRRQSEYVAPRNEIESEIAEIWSELLGVEQVGVFDEFFALGGHSLLATQAIMRIRRAHGDIPLGALLASPTVADLAEVVRSTAAAQK